MPKSYNTKQKSKIEAIIKSKNGEHFTCEDIVLKAKEQGENIGITTVYRHLDKMVRDGSLRKYSKEAGESACYQESHCIGHFHLKCVVCGKLIHLSCRMLEGLECHIKSEHQFSIDPARTVLVGVCGECGK